MGARWLTAMRKWRLLALVFLVAFPLGLYPGAAQAAPPTVTNIEISNLVAGVSATVSYQIDDQGASVSCQWQTAGTSTNPGTWTDVSGATACNNYSAPAGDNAKWHRIRITATNGDGSATYSSRAYRLGGEVLGMGSCGSGLQAARANGTSQSISVPAPGNGAYCYDLPDLSPDGRLIVFGRKQTPQAQWDLWLMDGSRTGARQLTNTSSLNESDPRFSPDGNRIAFRRYDTGLSSSSIVVYDLTTGAESEYGPFSDQTGNNNALEWLDDATLLFFAVSREGGTYSGDKWRYYTGWPGYGTGRDTDPAITCPYNSGSQKCTFISEVWQLDLSSGSATQVTDTTGPANGTEYDNIRNYKINPRDARLSPNGQTLIHNNSQNGRMLQIDTTTWGQTWTTFPACCNVWRSDGAKIFWSKPGWDSPGVYTVNPDTSGSTAYMTGFFLPVYDFGFLDPSGIPVAVVPPTIGGVFANAGESLSTTTGDWVPAASSYAYQWSRCTPDGSSCSVVQTGSSETYELTENDVGYRLKVAVTATTPADQSATVSSELYPGADHVILPALQQLALQFRPHLLFDADPTNDEGEKWRPVAIDTFVGEAFEPDGHRHQYCQPLADCEPFSDPGGFALHPGEEYWYADFDDAKAPPASRNCSHDNGYGTVVIDCDENGSVIYFHPGANPSGLIYLDYWWFLRYNHSPVPGFDHEGDWEGATILLETTGTSDPSVAAVAHAAHNEVTWILSSELSFSEDHALVYVANGTHAAYPESCAGGCGATESDYDGLASWGNNSDEACDAACVEAFPEAGGWTLWGGAWGADVGPEWPLGGGDSPQSPGKQTRYVCALEDFTGPGCPGIPWYRPGHSPRRGAEAVSIRDCSAWMGRGVAVVACDPKLLGKAIALGRLDARGKLQIALRTNLSGSFPGLAQAVGTPLRPGEAFELVGKARPDTTVMVAADVNERHFVITFQLDDVPRDARGFVVGASGGMPVLLANGKAVPNQLATISDQSG